MLLSVPPLGPRIRILLAQIANFQPLLYYSTVSTMIIFSLCNPPLVLILVMSISKAHCFITSLSANCCRGLFCLIVHCS